MYCLTHTQLCSAFCVNVGGRNAEIGFGKTVNVDASDVGRRRVAPSASVSLEIIAHLIFDIFGL